MALPPRNLQPAVHSPLLPQCIFRDALLQDEAGEQDAQGNPRTGEQKGSAREGQTGGGGIEGDEASEAARKIEAGIEKTLTYYEFPGEHWTRIRTNNVIERLNQEIRRRTRVVGAFPDGNSALMLVCARLRHVGQYSSFSVKPGTVTHK